MVLLKVIAIEDNNHLLTGTDNSMSSHVLTVRC